MKVLVHIKVNTGLNRYGISPTEVVSFVEKVSKLENVEIDGIYTHFATPYTDLDFTKVQYNTFQQVRKDLEDKNIHIKMYHCANSAAAMDLPDTQMDGVRVGFSLCNGNIGLEPKNQWNLKDAFELKTRVKLIRHVKKGDRIGYENSYFCPKDMTIGVLPIGYADGIPTIFAKDGYVLVRGNKCRIIGSICMNQIFIDLSHKESNYHEEDEVTIIGKQGNNVLTYRDIGMVVGAGDAETLLRVNMQIPRLFVT